MENKTSGGLEQIFCGWMERRIEASEDIRALAQFMATVTMPIEVLRFSQHVMANAWLRWTEDTTAFQEMTAKMMERSMTLGSDGAKSLAARTAAATRAAGTPLREASSYGAAD